MDSLPALLIACLLMHLFSGQGTRHAEKVLPRAGGAVWSRERTVQVVRGVQPGNTQSGAAGHPEESFLSCKKGKMSSS